MALSGLLPESRLQTTDVYTSSARDLDRYTARRNSTRSRSTSGFGRHDGRLYDGVGRRVQFRTTAGIQMSNGRSKSGEQLKQIM